LALDGQTLAIKPRLNYVVEKEDSRKRANHRIIIFAETLTIPTRINAVNFVMPRQTFMAA
jgi:hypothetical protein